MAVTTQAPPKPAQSLLKKKVDIDADLGIELPTEASEPSTNIGDYSMLIYGSKKIGKTSLASNFPNALSFMFEPGGKALSMFQLPCPTWAHFKQALDKVDASSRYETFVVDTGALAYQRCMEYACKKAEIEHPSDEAYGKGWNRVSGEFANQMSRLLLDASRGTIILCHHKAEEIVSKTGKSFSKILPDLSGQASGYYTGVIDIIGYYHLEDGKRWLQIREDDFAVAGCRPKDYFLTTQGKRVFKIPMGDSAEEAYANIVKAFNNKQVESYAPDGWDDATVVEPPKAVTIPKAGVKQVVKQAVKR